MQNLKIRPIKSEDIKNTARIYLAAFNKIGEKWTPETAEQSINDWFRRQPDLFFIATEGEKIFGGAAGAIQHFWDGPNLVDFIIFIHPDFQGKKIGKKLLKTLLREALDKHAISYLQGLANINYKMPLLWYEKIGLKESGWVHIEGDVKKILKKLK